MENGPANPADLVDALKKYLEESGETERSAAHRIGVNRHTLHRWLSEKENPQKRKLALAAIFLRRKGYL